MKYFKKTSIFYTQHDLIVGEFPSVQEFLDGMKRLESTTYDEFKETPYGMTAGLSYNNKKEYDIGIFLTKGMEDPRLVSILAHELIHAAYIIETDHGLFFNKEVQEPLTYFVESMIYDYMRWRRQF